MSVVPDTAVVGGPTLPQELRFVTTLPGPRTAALQARKAAAVAAGVSVTMPVYAVAAGGGVVVDVDGNSLIDLGSGIAATTVGKRRAGGRRRGGRPGRPVHPHLLHDHAVRRLRGRVRRPG